MLLAAVVPCVPSGSRVKAVAITSAPEVRHHQTTTNFTRSDAGRLPIQVGSYSALTTAFDSATYVSGILLARSNLEADAVIYESVLYKSLLSRISSYTQQRFLSKLSHNTPFLEQHTP